MKSICLCFQVHHPFHFQTFRFLDIGSTRSYYDDMRIEREINEAAIKYYLPSNDFLLKLINKNKGKLKVTFYISGTAIDQFLMYEPEVLTSFRKLADTGQVEFLGSTSSHSLISLTNQKSELFQQIKEYQSRISNLFGKKPLVFVNSDLIYSNFIGKDIADSGYRSMITNGSKKTLIWQSPNYVYSNLFQSKLQIYLRNEQISDEFAAYLNKLHLDDNEINTNNFFSLINDHYLEEPLLNIYTNYMNLGGAGIEKKQKYIQKLVSKISSTANMCFIFPSEIVDHYGSVGQVNADEPICWVKDFHSYYYPGNELQNEAIKQLYKLEKNMLKVDNLNLQKDWQYLQTSDHIHLMDEQHPVYQDNSVTNYIYKSKYDAFINYMNILDDFRLKIKVATQKKHKKHTPNSENSTRKQDDRISILNNLQSEE